jgi:DNA-directed RNA polymerase alpha subunit
MENLDDDSDYIEWEKLSSRARRALRGAGILHLHHVHLHTPAKIIVLPGVGKKTFGEIECYLATKGKSFAEWPV